MLIKSAKDVRTGDILEGPGGLRGTVLRRDRIPGIGSVLVFDDADETYLPSHAAKDGWKIINRRSISKPK